MARRRYTPKLKAQVVLEALARDKTPGRIARAYGSFPHCNNHKCQTEIGPGLFGGVWQL